jgi:hypothetical protein
LKTTALLNIKKLARATKITVDGHCLRALLKGPVSETFVSNETTTSFDSSPAILRLSQLVLAVIQCGPSVPVRRYHDGGLAL